MSTRKEVYAAIDVELDYQESKYGRTSSSNRTGEGERTLDEYALYINGYANQLPSLAVDRGYTKAKLDTLRKIAALCVKGLSMYTPQAIARLGSDIRETDEI